MRAVLLSEERCLEADLESCAFYVGFCGEMLRRSIIRFPVRPAQQALVGIGRAGAVDLGHLAVSQELTLHGVLIGIVKGPPPP